MHSFLICLNVFYFPLFAFTIISQKLRCLLIRVREGVVADGKGGGEELEVEGGELIIKSEYTV